MANPWKLSESPVVGGSVAFDPFEDSPQARTDGVCLNSELFSDCSFGHSLAKTQPQEFRVPWLEFLDCGSEPCGKIVLPEFGDPMHRRIDVDWLGFVDAWVGFEVALLRICPRTIPANIIDKAVPCDQAQPGHWRPLPEFLKVISIPPNGNQDFLPDVIELI